MTKLIEHYHDVPAGWVRVLDRLHLLLSHRDPEYKVDRVERKWGQLRVYLSTQETPEVLDAIATEEMNSMRTCEQCGAHMRLPKQTMIDGEWRSVCPTHGAEWPERGYGGSF